MSTSPNIGHTDKEAATNAPNPTSNRHNPMLEWLKTTSGAYNLQFLIAIIAWVIGGAGLVAGFHLNKVKTIEAEAKAMKAEVDRSQMASQLESAKAKTFELEQKLAPRQITDAQRAKFIELTKELPKGDIPIFRGDAGVETSNYINQVRAMLDAAGYTVTGRGVVPIIGLSVGSLEGATEFLLYSDETDLPDYAVPIQKAFIAIGINLLGQQWDNSGNGKLGPKQIAICIATRH